MTDARSTLAALIAEWESDVAEFATKDDPYYNGVRQCIQDVKAVVEEVVVEAAQPRDCQACFEDGYAEGAREIEAIRSVLNADLKIASERILTLELENQRLRASAPVGEAVLASVVAPAHPWQPIDTAPKDGTTVLLWCVDFDGNNGRVNVGSRHSTYGGTWWDRGMEYTVDHPTHWMPLPAAPVSPSTEPDR